MSDENEVVPFLGQDYEKLKAECLKSKKLFVDDKFPANATCIAKKGTAKNIEPGSLLDAAMKLQPDEMLFKRPKQINPKAEFVPKNLDLNDVNQGALADCWFIAAVVSLGKASMDYLNDVIHPEQTFNSSDYCGIFHFTFYHYGKWVDVVVDDQIFMLPKGKTRSEDQILFANNCKPGENVPSSFWLTLLEKAYAKLMGGFAHIHLGSPVDALIDLSGGIEDTYYDDDVMWKDKKLTWRTIKEAIGFGSILNTAIYAKENEKIEEKKDTGLLAGHAYSVTGAKKIDEKTRLLRIRNPHGNKGDEWNGAWSDGSKEWERVPKKMLQEMQMKKANDGEFWISLEDFIKHFGVMQIVHVDLDGFGKTTSQSSLSFLQQPGVLKPGKNAINPVEDEAKFVETNPQFVIRIKQLPAPAAEDEEEYDDEYFEEAKEKCTMIVSLMQVPKYYHDKEVIGFLVYRVKGTEEAEEAEEEYAGHQENHKRYKASELEFVKVEAVDGNKSSKLFYGNSRSYAVKFELKPAVYVIMPFTFSKTDVKYLLRVFTEVPVEYYDDDDEEWDENEEGDDDNAEDEE